MTQLPHSIKAVASVKQVKAAFKMSEPEEM